MPTPEGGRRATEVILAEDQLFKYQRKSRRKRNNGPNADEELFGVDYSPHFLSVSKTKEIAYQKHELGFSGKRNRNERRAWRSGKRKKRR